METACPTTTQVEAHECVSRLVVELLADKWTVLVLGALAEGPIRFGELRRELCAVSQKMLTQTLRRLERDGLVRRSVYPLPLAVEYALTPLGDEAITVLDFLRTWGDAYLPAIDAARLDYDARNGGPPITA